MSDSRLARAEEIYHLARELPAGERGAFVERATDGNPALGLEVRGLLAAADRVGAFLQTPAMGRLLEPLASGGEPDRPDDLVGQRLGPYRVLRRVATGGMGAVYEARRDDGEYEQRVALKVVKRGMDSEEIVARFRLERRALAGLAHPGIARLIDGGVAPDGRPYLVMEFVEGVPIDEHCRAHGLGIKERLRLFLRVCEAVRFAHQSLVVHRDLKPANILVTPSGDPRLLDFGIAKLLSPGDGTTPTSPRPTEPHERRLTPEYASPEQIENRAITTATDIYSLGVVLYQLLAGQRPYHFNTRSSGEIERVVCTVEPPAPSSIAGPGRADTRDAAGPFRRELRGDLDAIVLRALAKEPGARYASVEAFEADIRRYLDGLPVTARRGRLAYRARKFIRRHRLTVAAAAAFALLLVGGVAAVLWQTRLTARQRDEAYSARDEAEAVAEFMQNMLVAADPAESGPNLTVGRLVELVGARAESELQSRPLVQAAVYSAIGRTYLGLGSLDKAEANLQAAYELRSRLLPPDHHDLAESRMDIASLRYQQGRLEEAETLLEEALSTHQRLRGQNNLDTARVWNDLGAVRRRMNRLDAAEDAHRHALQIRTAINGAESIEVAESTNNLAGVALGRGDLAKAEELAAEALRIRRLRLRPDHPMLVQSIHNLAVIASRREGGRVRAISLLEEAERLGATSLGESHPEMLRIERNLGTQLALERRWEEAEPRLRRALASTAPADASARAQAAKLLAGHLRSIGRVQEADELERVYPYSNPPTR